MAATDVPVIRFDEPIVDGFGRLTKRAFDWFAGMRLRAGGDDDKIDAAFQTAAAAAPASTQVVASGGLQVGGTLTGNVGLAFYRVVTTVALLPTTGNAIGDWAYALDGRKPGEAASAGTGVPVWWSAQSAWYAVTSGAVVTS
ncbi:MAG: hypothetical protein ACYC8V_06740 [Caulobacteraceae bacterium]